MTLKPEYLNAFRLSNEYIGTLDVKMLISCLNQGLYASNMQYHLNKLRDGTYDKSSYKFLPKVIKYKTSEYSFDSFKFAYDAFYDYKTDKIIIEIDYCNFILSLKPNAKKPLKLFNALKTNHPEYFI